MCVCEDVESKDVADVVLAETRINGKVIMIARDASSDLWVTMSSSDNSTSEIVYAIDMKEANAEFKRFEEEARRVRASHVSTRDVPPLIDEFGVEVGNVDDWLPFLLA
jgi:hypothetical protein